MSAHRLLKQADYFLKLAQTDPHDSNLRELLINSRMTANDFSFREVANVVLQDLSALDREEKDTDITAASHALLDILNTLAVPNSTVMLSAAQHAANVIRQRYPQDMSKRKIANYLVRLVQLLINKYLLGHTPTDTSSSNSQSLSQFLSRIYQTLRSNQPLNEADRQKWNENKSWYTRRLQGLNSLSQLTPLQRQEKEAIVYVMSKVV